MSDEITEEKDQKAVLDDLSETVLNYNHRIEIQLRGVETHLEAERKDHTRDLFQLGSLHGSARAIAAVSPTHSQRAEAAMEELQQLQQLKQSIEGAVVFAVGVKTAFSLLTTIAQFDGIAMPRDLQLAMHVIGHYANLDKNDGATG